jgi:hypothetical protein
MRHYSRWRDWAAATGGNQRLGNCRVRTRDPGGTILSVIFAIVALFQTMDRRQRGRGLAIAAQRKSVHAIDLKTGDCVKDASESELPNWVKRVRCDRPHYGEVFAVLTLPDTPTYPGVEALRARSDECGPTFFDYAPNSPEGPTFRGAVAYPTADGWANGEGSVVCVAMSQHERWSSLRD